MSRRRLLVLGSLAGVNLLVFLAFTLPRSLERRTIDSRVETLRAEVGQARDRLAALEARDAVLRENARDTARFYDSIVKPSAQGMLPTIRYVDQAVSELGLTVGGRAWTERAVKGLGIVQFESTMPLSGPYPQIVAFLSRLERAPLFLVVDDVQLRMRNDSAGGDLAFHLSTFFKADSEDEGSHGT
jgi:Tfp pilus assembly protein PilO